MKRSSKGTRGGPALSGVEGFTLIELLVVIIIIGILAAVAVPQYFKVVERGRVVEAQSFLGSIKGAQERYLARYGKYASDLSKLDIGMAGGCAAATAMCGMKFYEFQGPVNVPAGNPDYILTLKRCENQTGCGAVPPAAYGTYSMVYTRSTGLITYTGGACTTAGPDGCAGHPCCTDF